MYSIPSPRNVCQAMYSDDVKRVLRDIKEYLYGYTSEEALDGERISEHQVVINTVVNLSEHEIYMVTRELIEAGWKSVMVSKHRVSFSFPHRDAV